MIKLNILIEVIKEMKDGETIYRHHWDIHFMVHQTRTVQPGTVQECSRYSTKLQTKKCWAQCNTE